MQNDRPLTCEIRELTGETVGVLILNAKTFKSGRVGFLGQSKLEVDGIRHQGQCQLVRIGEPES